MLRRTMMRVVLLGAALAAGAAHGGEAMNVHASLNVDARHDKVLVTFRIENRGERRAWLPRAIASADELTGRLFELHEQDGTEVAYTGPWVKRGPMTAADFVELAPHSAHTHTIDITPFYAFKPGAHTYTIRYEGQGLGDVKQLEAASPLETAAVSFVYAAP